MSPSDILRLVVILKVHLVPPLGVGSTGLKGAPSRKHPARRPAIVAASEEAELGRRRQGFRTNSERDVKDRGPRSYRQARRAHQRGDDANHKDSFVYPRHSP